MLDSDKPRPNLKLPENWEEQRVALPCSMEQRTEITRKLHQDIKGLLISAGIDVHVSFYRAKSDASIEAKRLRRTYQRIVDVYGTRFVLDEINMDRASKLIVHQYTVPEITEFPYVIDYRDSSVKQSWTSPTYKAVHVYFSFRGEEFFNIGEAQLLTPEWMKTANRTRRHFERRQIRGMF